MPDIKVDYAERELAPNGGNLPEDFGSYLEAICTARYSDGYRLIAVLPGALSDGHVGGAWLFFSRQEEDELLSERSDVGIATIGLEIPLQQTPPSIQPIPPPTIMPND